MFQCWKRLRINAKEKKANYVYNLQKTENNEVTPLTESVERICNIFGHYGTGLCIIPEIGVAERKAVKPSASNNVFLRILYIKLKKFIFYNSIFIRCRGFVTNPMHQGLFNNYNAI